MSNAVPPLLTALVDDAAVFPPGSAALEDAVPAHARHRESWFAPLIGPLLIPLADRDAFRALAPPGTAVGLVGEPAAVEAAIGDLPAGTRQIESPMAKRGEDPLPGIERLAALMRKSEEPRHWYLEVPLAWGLMSALDAVAALRAEGLPAAAKFRTGGLAAELFPTPVELAAVICACRDRDVPFKLTAGLHHAVRHTDAETGLVHHGFLNILAAVLAAADGAEPSDLAGILAATEGPPLADRVRPALDRDRPLWVGFGSCSVQDPVTDLTMLGLLDRPRPIAPKEATA
ncbi:hypothetical protein [Dactylosporangium sp. NPDC048998]|uniref:hypothetical protein n=1 Tax=Dactylosporangium sp. NPDC048998 TaxID=3363976 RepID=UPI0037132B97